MGSMMNQIPDKIHVPDQILNFETAYLNARKYYGEVGNRYRVKAQIVFSRDFRPDDQDSESPITRMMLFSDVDGHLFKYNYFYHTDFTSARISKKIYQYGYGNNSNYILSPRRKQLFYIGFEVLSHREYNWKNAETCFGKNVDPAKQTIIKDLKVVSVEMHKKEVLDKIINKGNLHAIQRSNVRVDTP